VNIPSCLVFVKGKDSRERVNVQKLLVHPTSASSDMKEGDRANRFRMSVSNSGLLLFSAANDKRADPGLLNNLTTEYTSRPLPQYFTGVMKLLAVN
jgi:hypothetical protein